MDKETRDFVMCVVKKCDQNTPVDSSDVEQAKKVIMANIELFALDGGWSATFFDDEYDLRLTDGEIWVFPWDTETETSIYPLAWKWFDITD